MITEKDYSTVLEKHMVYSTNQGVFVIEKDNIPFLIQDLMKLITPRYFVDIRGGCGAVRDRLHESYDESYPGLHHDTADVVEYRHGYQDDGQWNMLQQDIDYLHDLCNKLNEK